MRKRSIIIVVLGAVLLTGIGLFLFSRKADSAPLSLSFKRYGPAPDGVSTMAFLLLVNRSDNEFQTMMATNAFAQHGSLRLLYKFSDKLSTGWTNSMETVPPGRQVWLHVNAHSSHMVRVPLNGAGEIRRVALLAVQRPRKLPPFLDKLRRQWWRLVPPRGTMLEVRCDQDLSIATATNIVHAPTRITQPVQP